MLTWSKFFQNPEYLSLYRTMTLHPDFINIILKWIGITDGCKVLDVGCGTGAFTYYLSNGTKNCSYYGIDIDPTFINKANETINNNNNNFEFIVGDANSLPYPNDYFDVVTSYTFLTNMPIGKNAIAEMKRVVKKEGKISSVTAQSFEKIGFDGLYPISHSDYYHEYQALRKEIENLYESVQPSYEYVKYGTPPEKIPLLYTSCNLRNIEMYPLGWCYSLSNQALNKYDKEKHIKLFTIAEKNKFNAFLKLPQFTNKLSIEKSKRYFELLDLREKALLEYLGENSIWEWQGGSQLLLVAQK